MSKIRFNAGKYEIDSADLMSHLKIIALVLVNIIGRFISLIVAFWGYLRYAGNDGKKHSSKNDRLLFLVPAGIGDMAILVPILQEYRRYFYDSRLLLVTKPHCAELVDNLGFDILETFDHSNPKTCFRDWISILTRLWVFAPTTCIVPGTWRSNNNLLNVFARISGARYLVSLHRMHPQYPTQIFCNRFFDKLYTVSQTTHEREAAIYLLQKITAKHLFRASSHSLESPHVDKPVSIGIFVGASIPGKRWPASRFGELAACIASRYRKNVLIFAGPGEDNVAKKTQIASQGTSAIYSHLGSLRELMQSFSSLRLLISNDTGPMHIACLAGIPPIAIMGGDTVHMFMPWSKESSAAFVRNICRGCSLECNEKHRGCIDAVSVDHVWDLVQKVLG